MPLAWLSAGFQSLPPLATSKLGPSAADSQEGELCTLYNPAGLSSELPSEPGSVSVPQPPQVFTVIGLRLFSHSGTLG